MKKNARMKRAAAMAAVNAYLEQEAEAFRLEQEAAASRAYTGPDLWAVSGRQHLMSMRNMVQRRLFK